VGDDEGEDGVLDDIGEVAGVIGVAVVHVYGMSATNQPVKVHLT
jgi:hypothetical protein